MEDFSLVYFHFISLYEIYNYDNNKTKFKNKYSKQDKHILIYINKVVKGTRSEETRRKQIILSPRTYINIVSNSNKKFNSGLTHELSAFHSFIFYLSLSL